MIIGLCGYARSGKDSVAQTLVDAHGYSRFAYADALKAVAYDLNPWVEIPEHGFRRLADVVKDLGWEGAKAYPDVRLTLQRLGVAARDHTFEGIWLFTVANQVSNERLANVVITDVRFKNEAAWVNATGKLVRIERPGVGPVNAHRSESELATAKVDYTILNDGTLEDLAEATGGMIADLEDHAKVTNLAEYRRRRAR